MWTNPGGWSLAGLAVGTAAPVATWFSECRALAPGERAQRGSFSDLELGGKERSPVVPTGHPGRRGSRKLGHRTDSHLAIKASDGVGSARDSTQPQFRIGPGNPGGSEWVLWSEGWTQERRRLNTASSPCLCPTIIPGAPKHL